MSRNHDPAIRSTGVLKPCPDKECTKGDMCSYKCEGRPARSFGSGCHEALDSDVVLFSGKSAAPPTQAVPPLSAGVDLDAFDALLSSSMAAFTGVLSTILLF